MLVFKPFLSIYNAYVIDGPLKFIPTYKLNQDHIELFFGMIRPSSGHNNKPTTCRQFTAVYKNCLIHAEVRHKRAGNCIPLND